MDNHQDTPPAAKTPSLETVCAGCGKGNPDSTWFVYPCGDLACSKECWEEAHPEISFELARPFRPVFDLDRLRNYSPVNINEAKGIALSHSLDQIVIWSWKEGQGHNVTTWGRPLQHSLWAAESGNRVKAAAGYPPIDTTTLPASLAEIFAAVCADIFPAVGTDVLHRASVEAVFYSFIHVIAERDPELATKLRTFLNQKEAIDG